MHVSKKSLIFSAGVMAIVGMIAGSGLIASAQSSTPATASTSATVETSSGHHAPIGGDGVVASVTGTTIVMAEEADEGGASYTIDVSKATVSKNGAAATLADVTAGSKIFVEGAVNGTSVSATSISVGHPGHKGDTDSDGQSETGEGPETADDGQ